MTSYISNLWSKSPLGASFGQHAVLLPLDNDDSEVGAFKESTYTPQSQTCELRIESMTCGSCVEVCLAIILHFNFPDVCIKAIEGMLRDQEGIHSVKVALLAERGIIQYDPKVWTEDKLINVCLSGCSLNLSHTFPGNI